MASGAANSRRIRTLIVDDSLVAVNSLSSFLERQESFMVVGVANNGAQAVSLTESLHPDLVLMDLHMPSMNGLEATRHLKAQPGAPVVIILTVDGTPRLREAANRAGADGFVPKAEVSEQLSPLLVTLFGEGVV